MKTILLPALLSMLLWLPATAQTFKKDYTAAKEAKDTTAQQRILQEWEAASDNDPELYVALFNYYANKSRNAIIALGNEPGKGDAFALYKEGKDKNGTPDAYLYEQSGYDTRILKTGFGYAEKGIVRNPNRLDLRFGKVYMYGEIGDWESFTTELERAIDYSVKNNNQWLWTDSKPVSDGKKFLLTNLQTYQLQIYNTGNDSLLRFMKRIALAVIKHYPDHTESLSNLSVVYLINNDYNEALKYLHKAEKINGTDFIVLNNIARAYELKGNKKKAIEYYRLTIKHGDKQAKSSAEAKLKELEK